MTVSNDFNKLIEDHYHIIKILVYDFRKNSSKCYLDIDEMISVAHDTIIRCAKYYDPEKSQFRTYLSKSIRMALKDAEIKEAIRRQKTVYVTEEPENFSEEEVISYFSLENKAADYVGTEEHVVAMETINTCGNYANLFNPKCPFSYSELFKYLILGYNKKESAKLLNTKPYKVSNAIRFLHVNCENRPSIFRGTLFERYSSNTAKAKIL